MIDKIYKFFEQSTGICTDTRSIQKRNLFFALKGPNFNANKFAKMAIDRGAIHAIIDDKDFEIPGYTTLVEDGLSALQNLARLHRRKLKIPVIGITGSNGKTTTKELIHEVLKTKYRAFATKGNLNNHIGVPLSVLSVNKDHEIAIIEMGANHIGEIADLCTISMPTHGLITNIGKAHTGLFGGLEGVIRAKSELYEYLIVNDRVIFVNENQEILMNMSKRLKAPVFYPSESSFCPCHFIDSDPYVKFSDDNSNVTETKLIGQYNFDNIATALCVGKYFDIDQNLAQKAVANYKPSNNRSQVIKKKNNTIFLDAYNANPSSMEKAIENLGSSSAKTKVVILGDMFELGDDTEKEHAQVGELLKSHAIDSAFFCGTSMAFAHEAFGKGQYAKDKEALIEILKSKRIENASILIKASRGMALEDMVDYL